MFTTGLNEVVNTTAVTTTTTIELVEVETVIESNFSNDTDTSINGTLSILVQGVWANAAVNNNSTCQYVGC